MRFLNTLKNDIRFQIKYGFYFLYAFFSAVYIAILIVTPMEYKKIVASLIILTDPAMLGIFFIGGIWLLEKGEGLHRVWSVSPLRPMEYILSKCISLAMLSTVSADMIVLLGMNGAADLMVLSLSVCAGAVVCNLIGLAVASYARSVNHYMMIVILPLILLSMPPVLTAFGITHPLLEIFPGTALWHMIANAADPAENVNSGIWIILFWLLVSLIFTHKRIGAALQTEGSKHT